MEWKPYLDRFEISDTGICRKIKSKLPYTVRLNNGSPTVNYRVRETHEAFNLAQVVYHLYVDSTYKGHLYHKDGDKLNCSVGNLVPSVSGTREPWQVEQFKAMAYPSIKWFVGKYAVMQFLGWDATDDEILKAVHKVEIYVDKEELLRALKYDRDQFNIGFNAGYEQARKETAREILNDISKEVVFEEDIHRQEYHIIVCKDKVFRLMKKIKEKYGVEL